MGYPIPCKRRGLDLQAPKDEEHNSEKYIMLSEDREGCSLWMQPFAEFDHGSFLMC